MNFILLYASATHLTDQCLGTMAPSYQALVHYVDEPCDSIPDEAVRELFVRTVCMPVEPKPWLPR